MLRLAQLVAVLALPLALLPGCVEAEIEDEADAGFVGGKADGGIDEGSPEALGVLSLVNSGATTVAILRAEGHLSTRVATNIITQRDGADRTSSTPDDNRFDTLAELDAVSYVGPVTLAALVELARAKGLVRGAPRVEVIFSPQLAPQSHNARIAQMIRGAQHDVDVSIYSYSDAGISAALADAVARGVRVRFLFETANSDRKLVDATARASSKSGRLEAMGVDVRYVNQINHHKFVIVDGPRDDRSRAATAKLAMGSANFSSTGGTLYDENTFFVEGSAEIAAAYQAEFDKLWRGSRDFVGPAPAQGQSTAGLTAADVPDDAGLDGLFTSANFKPGGSDGTTWRVNKDSLAMADVWVAAIAGAETSIHIASGHLRLKPVADALVAKKQANPAIDIRLYLDQQEFISFSGARDQRLEVEECIARATTTAKQRDCAYNNYLFSKDMVDTGIDVRFKSYTYRWDASFAVQMHSKYMVIDGNELLSGSYNLSMNAEHGSFENALHVTGTQFAPLISAFEQNFLAGWDTNRANDTLAKLRTEIATAATIPLVFPPISLTDGEFEALRALIRSNCTAADSVEFRENPAGHKTCTR